MNLNLDTSFVTGYTSSSQIARLMTEHWVGQNVFCPSCGNPSLSSFKNNNPVGDFQCKNCTAEYELKSKKDKFEQRIVDGAFSTMIQRINSFNNPHFFFLNYSTAPARVKNFIVIPKHFFIDDIIEKRKPLAETARRAGWTGCNILLNRIPTSGKIFIVDNEKIVPKESVISTWNKTAFLENQKKEARGWTIKTLKLLDRVKSNEFDLSDVYAFEKELKVKFPSNNFIKDKLRQQLQVLRDKGLLEFQGRGRYRKISC